VFPPSVEIWAVYLGVRPRRFDFVGVNSSLRILEVETVVYREVLVPALAEKKVNHSTQATLILLLIT
jgi:hypothetical protein